MSIERLRALEKQWKQLADYAADDKWDEGYISAMNSAADDLSRLIADLGQEVGAVEPVGYMDPDADFMLPRKGQCVLSSHVVLVRDPHGKYTRPIYLSPAHTSEARDSERLDWLDAKCTNVADEYGIASQLYFGTYATGKLREAIDAAMRQEGGTP